MVSVHPSKISLEEELTIARQILNYIMSPANANIAFPFMDRVDAQTLGLQNYDEVVRFPTWLRKVSDRLDHGKYPGLREFVCDFRLILVNTFRYNGVSSRMGRLAEKLEILLEQKLQLLPPELRAKTTLHASLGCGSAQQEANDNGPIRRRASTRHYGGNLDSQISHPVRGLMEELEHSMPSQEIGCGGVGASSTTSCYSAAFLYEASPGLPVTSANSHALLVARLTEWQRKQHEVELIASWKDWWQANTQARTRLAHLRKCPQFLEAFQLLWLLDPFLGFSDAMAVGTMLYHDVAFHADMIIESALLPLATTTPLSRQFSLTELELGMCAAPQASICLAACISGLLLTQRERETVCAAVAALTERQEQQKNEAKNNGTTGSVSMEGVDECGVQAELGEESRRLAGRRLQGCHVTTVKTLAVPPYETWERRLAARIAQWYEEMPQEKRMEDPFRFERRYGISQAFFYVCGQDKSPLEEKRFHELAVHQQSHILLALASTVLLFNGNFGFAENLRFSMDKSSDWEGARPIPLGCDAFRSLHFFHFPEMLRSETPRILQYCFSSSAPSSDYLGALVPPPLPPPLPLSVNPPVPLPGVMARLPTWIEYDLAQAVHSNLLTLIERELEVLGSRCDDHRGSHSNNNKAMKKDKAKMHELTAILAPLQTAAKDPRNIRGKEKANGRKAVQPRQHPNGCMRLANFAFVNKISCGVVPISAVYARQAGFYTPRSSTRAVESSASQAESATITNTSEAPTPNPPKFFQEEAESNPSESVQHTEEEDCDGSGNSTASTTPCREASGDENPYPLHGLKKEEEEVEEEGTKAVLDDQGSAMYQCNGFGDTMDNEEVKEDLSIADRIDDKKDTDHSKVDEISEEEKKVKVVAELIAKAVEAELENSHCFETVVYDLDSCRNFHCDIASRIAKGRRLLDELVAACDAVLNAARTGNASADHHFALRSVIDRFAADLGDAVLAQIKADSQLALALEPKDVGNIDSVQTEAEKSKKGKVDVLDTVSAKNCRKRRKSGLFTPRPRKSARKSKSAATVMATESEAYSETDTTTTAATAAIRHILRLHEEALVSLTSLAEGLDAVEADLKDNDEERLAAGRLAGLLLRKDIEASQPKPVKAPKQQAKQRASIMSPSPLGHTSSQSQVQSRAPVENYTASKQLPSPPTSHSRILIPRQASTSGGAPHPSPILLQRAGPPLVQQPLRQPRRIFRFYDTLFTEEGRPVRLEANGAVVYISPESVPLGHRQMALQMIKRFNSSSTVTSVPHS